MVVSAQVALGALLAVVDLDHLLWLLDLDGVANLALVKFGVRQIDLESRDIVDGIAHSFDPIDPAFLSEVPRLHNARVAASCCCEVPKCKQRKQQLDCQ